jgi:hypothetical protein
MRNFLKNFSAAVIAITGLSAGAGAVSPGSDSFAGAPLITGIYSVESLTTTQNFTTEAGEPGHVPGVGGHSAWWKWTAPSNGFCTVETLRTAEFVNTGIAVYTGTTLNSLTRIAANDNLPGEFVSRVTFFATAGSTYRIAVESEGLLTIAEVLLQLRFVPAKPRRLISRWQSPNQDTVAAANGLVTLNITQSGALTGVLTKGSTRIRFKSQTTTDGFVVVSLPRPVSADNPQGVPITIYADLVFVGDFTINPGALLVTDGSNLQGIGILVELNQYTTASPCPHKGTYNLVLKFPASVGSGFAIAKVSPTGAVRMAAVGGDGQPISLGTAIADDDLVLAHQALKNGTAFLNGEFFVSAPLNRFRSSECAYRRPPAPGLFYPNGFFAAITAEGSRYVPPAAGKRALDLLQATNGAGALTTVDAPGELGSLTEMLTFSTANKFMFTSAARKPVLKLNPATGLATGTITTAAGVVRPIRGLLLKDDFGAIRVRGFVGGKTRTADFTVGP